MKIKLYSHIVLTSCLLLIPFYMFYEDYQSVNDLSYLVTHLLSDENYRVSLILFGITLILVIGTAKIEIGYDKEEGTVYQKIFTKRVVKCSDIAFLVYVGGLVGDIYVLNKFQNSLLYMTKVFHKKKVLKLFYEIKKDYPQIEIIS